MEFFYKKYDNTKLFSNLENIELTNLSNIQNYVPIYKNFFCLNENNYNTMTAMEIPEHLQRSIEPQ